MRPPDQHSSARPFPPQIPRRVPHIYLTSGNRAELLVRCNQPGTYTLTAGYIPSAMGLPADIDVMSIRQHTVMTLRVEARHAGVAADVSGTARYGAGASH